MDFSQLERVLLSIHTDTIGVTQCMATICLSTCLRTSFWFGFYLIMPVCSIFTSPSSPKHLQDTVAHTCRGLLKMVRWQRCVSAHCYMIFCYPDLDKQKGFGCGFDFLLPPEMCPDGCAGDGCLRNQQNLSCLARAESLVLPRAGKKQGRYKCSRWKVKGFSALHTAGTPPRSHSTHQPLPGPGDAASNCCQPGSDHPRGSPVSLQAEGSWVFTKWTFYCIKQFSFHFSA